MPFNLGCRKWKGRRRVGGGGGTGCQPPTPTILWNKTFLYIKLENIKVLLVNNKFIYWIRNKWQKVDRSFWLYGFSGNTLNSYQNCYVILLCIFIGAIEQVYHLGRRSDKKSDKKWHRKEDVQPKKWCCSHKYFFVHRSYLCIWDNCNKICKEML